MMNRNKIRLVGGVLLAVMLTACGQGTPDLNATEVAAVEAGEASFTKSDDLSAYDDLHYEGYRAGDPVPVANPTLDTVGWVDFEAYYDTDSTELLAVNDKGGARIAWWSTQVGWLSDAEVEDPKFDLEARISAVEAQRRADLEKICAGDPSFPAC